MKSKKAFQFFPRVGKNGGIIQFFPRVGKNEWIIQFFPRVGKNEWIIQFFPRVGKNDWSGAEPSNFFRGSGKMNGAERNHPIFSAGREK
jgi:hypothetical protein